MSALTETNPHIKITRDNTTARLRRSARIVGRALLAIVGALVLLLIAIPVLVAPFITGTPLWLSLVLIAMDVALVVALVRFLSYPKRAAGIVAAWIGVSLLAIWFSQMFAYTPPIVDANGNALPNSIAVLDKVKLNDSEQWISIRGKDKNKPLLLFLAGGPGGSQLVTARRTLARLEDYFVVVNWEQPGAAKSFDAVPRATLTPERYIQDGRALVLYLRERFGQDKVYVVGESWGSALGILLVQRYPELSHAFIGTGQMVAFTETDVMDYEFALNWARERGDAEKVAQLEAQGPPPYYGAGVAMKQAAYLLDTFAYMNQNPAIPDNGFNTLDDLAAHDYGLYDKVNYVRGVLDTLDVVYPQLWDIDFRKTATTLDVPVYFLIGRHDVNAPPKLWASSRRWRLSRAYCCCAAMRSVLCSRPSCSLFPLCWGGGVLALSAAQVLSGTLTFAQVMMFVIPFVILTAFAMGLTILLLRSVSEHQSAEAGAIRMRVAQI